MNRIKLRPLKFSSIFRSINGENAHYGTPTNPCAPDRVPGGSSSGSAVAVGAKLVDFALGQQSPCPGPFAFLVILSLRIAANSFSYHFPLCNIGTDTGGSVRVPAAYCGIFGLRPSHGLVSTENVIPMSQMFDTVGRLLFLSFFLSLLLSVFMSYCCILLYEI